MGYENIGILFYGIVLGEQEVPWDNPNHEGDWEDCYLEKTGFYAADPKPMGEPDWKDREASSRWYSQVYEPWKQRKEAALVAAGCRAGIYNSCHNPWSFIALSAAHTEGGCHPAREIDPTRMLLLPPDADDIIRQFCGYMDVPYQQPRWYLTGLYS